MAGTHVMFFSVSAPSALPHVGETDDQGHYSLKPVIDDQPGIVPGRYRVVITTAVAEPSADENTPLPPERVPLNWRDGLLGFEVPEGGTTEANFDMTSK